MFIVRRIPINGNGMKIAYLHRNCQQFNIENLACFSQIELQSENKSAFACLQIIEDDMLIKPDEIGLNIEAFTELGLKEYQKINICLAMPTTGLNILHKKISGNQLDSAEYEKILNDIGSQRFSSMQTTAFVMACQNMMTNYELAAIAGLLINHNVIKSKDNEKVVSCYSFGKTGYSKAEIISCLITAAAGYKVLKPQTSEDCLVKISDINLKFSELIDMSEKNKIVFFNSDILAENKTGRILTRTYQNIGIKQNNFMIALVLATAVSYGITHLLIDIPIGETAEIRTYNEAIRMRGIIEHLADLMGLTVEVCLTDGNEPLGNNFGSVLETNEIISVLQNHANTAKDVREHSLFLAGRMLDLLEGYGKKSFALAAEILDSGKSFSVFESLQHIKIKTTPTKNSLFHRDVLAAFDGIINKINNETIKQLVILADRTNSLGGGLVLNKKTGDTVKSGDILYTVYSVDSTNFDAINTLVERDNGYDIAVN